MVHRGRLLPAVATMAALIVLWIGLPAGVFELAGSWQNSGSIGDTFNIANSLFTALALIGVVYSLQRQRDEDKQRFEEMRLQQISSARQIMHLGLSTKLQTVQTLIEDHRKALVELRPRLEVVPRASSKLRSLREEVATEVRHKPGDESVSEALGLLDELMVLQAEILEIRRKIEESEGMEDV